jgi:hypothetical protein
MKLFQQRYGNAKHRNFTIFKIEQIREKHLLSWISYFFCNLNGFHIFMSPGLRKKIVWAVNEL